MPQEEVQVPHEESLVPQKEKLVPRKLAHVHQSTKFLPPSVLIQVKPQKLWTKYNLDVNVGVKTSNVSAEYSSIV